VDERRASARSIGSLAGDAHAHPERVAGQIGQRQVNHLHDLQRRGVRASADRALPGDAACLGDGRIGM
jgi:hypothetical protein